MIKLAIQTDTGYKSNARAEKDASTSDHETRKTSPIHKPTKKTSHKT
jgi:hypothetical protein